VEDVGAFEERNELARRAWDRERRIAHVVPVAAPLVLDIGAHIGQSNRLFRRMFPTATIWSFEADPDTFATLVASVDASLPGGCVQVALSDRDGQATFHRNPIGHTSSLYARNPDSTDSIDQARARAEGRDATPESQVIHVDVRRLDGWCDEQGITAIDLLKIDVQGAEVDVLRGATSILAATTTVVVEISFFDLYERSNSFLDVESILAPLGLRLYALAEVSDNPMNGRTDWVTAIYTRAPFTAPPPPA
jgi:FkbM family methyltransferase